MKYSENLEFVHNIDDPYASEAFQKFCTDWARLQPSSTASLDALRRAFGSRLKYVSQFEIGEPVQMCDSGPVELLKRNGLVGLYRNKE